jgi:hypothetical protein
MLLVIGWSPAQAAYVDMYLKEGTTPNTVDLYAEGDTPLGLYVVGIVHSTNIVPTGYRPTDAMGIPGIEQFGSASVGEQLIYAESYSTLPSNELPLSAKLATITYELLLPGLVIFGFNFAAAGDLTAVSTMGTGTAFMVNLGSSIWLLTLAWTILLFHMNWRRYAIKVAVKNRQLKN